MSGSRTPHFALGAALVFGSALIWSFGGAIARMLEVGDPWVTVFWRSVFAAAFLIAFMLLRDGPRGTLRLFSGIGVPGVAVAVCFSVATIAFILALQHTTVANILLIQAGVPLIAALMTWILFRERPALATWVAIAVVIAGIAIMVSDTIGGGGSVIGDVLAVVIAIAFASATVITRRYAHVRMTPACCLGTVFAATIAAIMAGSLSVSTADLGWLFVFGALNLGLGMALFVTGARMVPSTFAALIGTSEPVMGPVWVWLSHGETPSNATLVGGAVVLAALLAHIAWQMATTRDSAAAYDPATQPDSGETRIALDKRSPAEP